MGNMCVSGEDEQGSFDLKKDYKVDRTDPSRKRAKVVKRTGAGTGITSASQSQGFEMENEVAFAVKKSEFAEDPELEQGFPEENLEYVTSPWLDDVNDEYTRQDKDRVLKKKDKSGAQDAMYVSPEFAEVEEAG